MTEAEARGWVEEHFGTATVQRLTRFEALLRGESAHQNLIARSTFDHLWGRHFVDSLQLIRLAPEVAEGRWIDIGSGAGLPGLVIALASSWPVALVEPRKRRCEFLTQAMAALDIEADLHCCRAERLVLEPAQVISARAVASVDAVFAAAYHLSDVTTRWILPKGRGLANELESARTLWQGTFHVEHSLTDPESKILIAERVRRR